MLHIVPSTENKKIHKDWSLVSSSTTRDEKIHRMNIYIYI